MRIIFKLSKSNVFVNIFGLSFLASSNIILAETNTIQAFANPDYIVDMDEKWESRSIVHDEKTGKADLVVSLGQVTYPALRQFIEEYAVRKGIEIVMQQGTCGVSAKKLSRKAIDVGAFCCPPGKTDRLPGIEFHTIGIAPIALITNPDNELSGLSLSEARKIFSGDTVRWSEVSAENKIRLPPKDIQPIVRLHCKKRPGHWRHILDTEDMFSSRIREVGVIPDMIKDVAQTKSAIGFETEYMLEVHKENGEVKVLKIDGHHPSDLQHLLFAGYPFYRTFNLTTWTGSSRDSMLSKDLVNSIKKHIQTDGYKYGMISSESLRLAGWKFKGDELTGEPDGNEIFREHQ